MNQTALMLLIAIAMNTTAQAGTDIYAYPNLDGSVVLTNIPAVTVQPLWMIHAACPQAEVLPPAPLPVRGKYEQEVKTVAHEYSVDGDLIHAVIATESAYASNAVSAKGAIGLMQLMPRTAKSYGIANPFDAIENIRAGAQHLRHLLSAFDGDMELALAAYNAGEQAVMKHGRKIPPFPETISFVRLVQTKYRARKLGARETHLPP
jgi:soluble lytic murein transglycosylase-like protein